MMKFAFHDEVRRPEMAVGGAGIWLTLGANAAEIG
jgi:hypothetical protein